VLRITFDVLDVRPPRELTLESRLPFGVTNHEQIQITPNRRAFEPRDIQLTLRLPARLAGAARRDSPRPAVRHRTSALAEAIETRRRTGSDSA
jgi:hypothetical protein